MKAAAIFTLLAVGCGSGGDAPASLQPLDPDVPTWRGGCFLSGSPGKIVNGSPSPDVRLFGTPCSDPPGPGGLVYLDRFDPVSGDGDVTVLSAAPGSAPVVIAPGGGGGAVVLGSTGVQLDDGQARVLALASVSFVTGNLVVASLPTGAPVQSIASGVRLGNYEFVPGGGVFFVGNYDPATREGDLLLWSGDIPQVVASKASRFDFVMYRLAPDRMRVAYLRGWKEESGGELLVQSLPPGPGSGVPVATGVTSMAWTEDGHLVFLTRNPDGITFAIWAWGSAGVPALVAPEVSSLELVGNDLLYATGWSVLAQRASLHLVPVTGGADLLAGAGPAALTVGISRPPGTDGVLAYLVPPSVPVPSSGELFLTPVTRFAPVRVDDAVSIDAGIGTSPDAGFVSYAVGFDGAQAPGSANPQPGVAQELRVAAVTGAAPFTLARVASTFVAWDPGERFVAAIGAFAPALNRGELVVRSTSGGAQLLSVTDVGNARFGFAADGSLLWAIASWDDALRRGELVLAPASGTAAWQAVPIAADVSWVAEPRSGRVIYGVRGGGRDGLWLGALQ